ncbi:hypothetical protein QQG55_25380 [Brugia pahangi]
MSARTDHLFVRFGRLVGKAKVQERRQAGNAYTKYISPSSCENCHKTSFLVLKISQPSYLDMCARHNSAENSRK